MELLARGAADLGLRLTQPQLEQFQHYYEYLVQWNGRVNLTAVTGPEEVQTRHFLDSLNLSAVLPRDLSRSRRVLDVGSGAGLPGLPLKIAYPQLDVTLLEATAKKTAFLEHVVMKLGLPGVRVHRGRAEELAHDPAHRQAYDLVASRAVAKLSVLAELCLPFCLLGGLVVAQKGPVVENEIADARSAVQSMGGRLKEVIEVPGHSSGKHGNLVVLEKVSPTPDRFPRRPGVPAKRPL